MRKWVAGFVLAAVVSLGGWFLLRDAPRAVDLAPTLAIPASLVRPDSDAGRRTLSTIDRLHADPTDAEAWYRMGLAHRAGGSDDLARECFEQAAARDAAHARARYHLAILEHESGSPVAAAARCREALESRSPYSPGWCRLGEWLLELDDVVGARAAFARALDNPQGSPRAWLGLARIALREGQPAAAASRLQPLVAQPVCDPLAHQLYATALVRLGRGAELPPAIPAVPVDQSDPWLDEIEAYRDDRRSRSNLASLQMASGNFSAAISTLEALRREEPDNPAIACNLVAAHRARGDLRRSAEMGEDAVRQFPDSHQPYFNLALTRLAMGSRPDGTMDALERAHACRLLDAAIERNPSAAQPRAVRARLHLDAGEHDAAIAQLRRAAIADPLNAAWPLEQGRAELAAGRPEAAIEALERARRLGAPRDAVTGALATAKEALAGAGSFRNGAPAAAEGGAR